MGDLASGLMGVPRSMGCWRGLSLAGFVADGHLHAIEVAMPHPIVELHARTWFRMLTKCMARHHLQRS